MTDIRYKWVFRHEWIDEGGQNHMALESHVASGRACVVYQPGIFVTSPDWLFVEGYHLTVFSTYYYAEEYNKQFSQRMELWECEVEDCIIRLPRPLSTDHLRDGFMISHNMIIKWPLGTEMWKRVKLTRRLK